MVGLAGIRTCRIELAGTNVHMPGGGSQEVANGVSKRVRQYQIESRAFSNGLLWWDPYAGVCGKSRVSIWQGW